MTENTDETIDVPHQYDKNKHTRTAYRLGATYGRDTMLNQAELRDWTESGTIDRGLEESIESTDWTTVGYHVASNSRDIGTHRGLMRLNTLEDIADDGTTVPRFCTDGDSAMICYASGFGSALVAGKRDLLDETIEAYDDGFARAFAAKLADETDD